MSCHNGQSKWGPTGHNWSSCTWLLVVRSPVRFPPPLTSITNIFLCASYGGGGERRATESPGRCTSGTILCNQPGHSSRTGALFKTFVGFEVHRFMPCEFAFLSTWCNEFAVKCSRLSISVALCECPAVDCTKWTPMWTTTTLAA